MDAVEFLKELKRRKESRPTYYGNMIEVENIDPVALVAQVETWSKDHPAKTRQSELLKMFPNAFMDGQVLNLCPKGFEGRTDCTNRYDCANCRREYWLQEVE